MTKERDIREGELAPDFTLPASNGREVSLRDYRGRKNVVLYFYPKDNTPGCTREACDFRDQHEDFEQSDTIILGVSKDNLSSHERFIQKLSLPFILLSDTEGKVCNLYGVWKEKNMYGKKAMGIERTTFVIDKAGVIRKIFPRVKVDGHAREVLRFIEEML